MKDGVLAYFNPPVRDVLIITIKTDVWVEQDQLHGLHGRPYSIVHIFNYEDLVLP
jgi:hypothetical protein